MKVTFKHILTIVLLILGTKILIGFTFFNGKKVIKEEIVEYTHTLIPGSTVEISNRLGDISISGWNKDTIYVKAIKKAPQDELAGIKIETYFTDKQARIVTLGKSSESTRYSISFFSFNFSKETTSTQVDYIVKVPYDALLKSIATKNGDIIIKDIDNVVNATTALGTIKAENIKKELSLKSQNGDITCTTVGGPVVIETARGAVSVKDALLSLTIHTSNGDVKVVHSKGPLTVGTALGSITGSDIENATFLTTKNGNIELEHRHGPLTVSTVRGNVKVHKLDGPSTISATNGDVSLTQQSLSNTKKIDIQTVRGSIKLTLPKTAQASLQAKALSGTVKLTHFDTALFKEKSSREIEAFIGGKEIQEPKIVLQTTNGSITVGS